MLNSSGDGGNGRGFDGMRRSRSRSLTTQSLATDQTPAQPANSSQVGARSVQQRSLKRRRGLIMAAVATPLIAAIGLGGWLLWPRSSNEKLSAASLAASVVKSSVAKATLKGEADGRTNVVIYGMTKDGLRTDSIMLASYYWQDKKLVTLNIPRDLQITDGVQTAKLGEMYAYAKGRKPKDDAYPSQYVADLIAKEYDVPVDYWVKLNMRGEVDLINTLGGIDVTVENAFTDYHYPKWDYSGYITPAPSFTAGQQHMDGDRALIYSRSRHSLDANEGTDFARSKRQMIVLASIMTKVKQMGIAGNIADVGKYLQILGDNVDTNMTTDEMVAFVAPAKALDPAADLVRGSWATGNGFLCDSKSAAGAYITLYGVPGACTTPAGGKATSKYRELAQYYVQNLLTSAPLAPAEFVTAATPNLPQQGTANTTAGTSSATSSGAAAGGSTATSGQPTQGSVLPVPATPTPTPLSATRVQP